MEIAGWEIEGPFFKDKEHYLSSDGDNPEAPWPGYGWPLDTECWFFTMVSSKGDRRTATGLTVASAEQRAREIGRQQSAV